jgi:hypothetical protein
MRILPILAGVLFTSAAYAQPTPPPPDMLPPYPGQQGAPPPAEAPPPGAMQAPPPAQTGRPSGPPAGHMGSRQRFEAANTTHDGRLTMDQAQAASWRPIARNFQAIDRDHKGYVTMQDIKEWHRARHAAKAAAAAPPQ